MKLHRSNTKGFSLVELLAVVLILAVLAAVAVPLYLNTRKTSAARACKANINAIASAEAAYALRNGCYVTQATLASTSPEGLSSTVKCPLDNTTAYKIGLTNGANDVSGTTAAQIWITCPNATTHASDLSGSSASQTDWQRSMSAINSDPNP